MTDRYLSSITGNAANTGETSFANAKATFAEAITASLAGDTVYVAGGHTETFAASVSVTTAGTTSAPVRLICASDSASPPTAEASTAVIAGAASNYMLTILGSIYVRGITFRPGSTGSAVMNINTGDEDIQVYEKCKLELTAASSTSKMNFGLLNTSNSAITILKDTWLKFAQSAQEMSIWHKLRVIGGGITSGSTQISSLIEGNNAGNIDARFDAFDLTALSTTFNIVGTGALQSGNIELRGCKFPAGWVGNLFGGTSFPGLRITLINAMIGTVKLPIWTQDAYGQCKSVSTVYRTGGGLEDATPLTLQMISFASAAAFPALAWEGAPIGSYIDSSGTEVTRYLEIAHESQGSGTGGALTNAEFGARIVYPGGVSEVIKAGFFAAAADLPTSSATWTGLTSPVKQRVALTFTPSVKGAITVTPLLFASGKTVYVCSKLEA